MKQWLDQLAPCYAPSSAVASCEKIVALAHEQAFEEIPNANEMRMQWSAAHARWCKYRLSARTAYRLESAAARIGADRRALGRVWSHRRRENGLGQWTRFPIPPGYLRAIGRGCDGTDSTRIRIRVADPPTGGTACPAN